MFAALRPVKPSLVFTNMVVKLMRKSSISKSGTNNVDVTPIDLGGVAPPVVTASKYWLLTSAQWDHHPRQVVLKLYLPLYHQ